jgi:ubiquinone/menaquinone biosynthesis C-methylase UbiE
MAEAPAGSNWGNDARTAAAQRWEHASAEMGRAVTEALVEAADPRPGMRALDVACGTGAPALQVARRVTPRGWVNAIDIASEPLAIAALRARERGLSNVRFERADAHQLPFAEGEFDLVTSRFGVMFFSDPGRALGEMGRVLRPGGRAAIAAWGPFEQPYFEATAKVVMRYTGLPLPPPAARMFQFGAPGSLSRALTSAGFRQAGEELRLVPWVWPDTPEELWAYFRAVTVPFRPLLEAIPAEQRAAVDGAVYAALERHRDGPRVNLTAEIVIATAIKS